MNLKLQAEKLAKLLKDKKAQDVLVINVENQTTIASFLVLATANSNAQARGMANYVQKELDELGINVIRKDVKSESEWLVLDYGDIIVHIMTEEVREYIKLEKLWVKNQNSVAI